MGQLLGFLLGAAKMGRFEEPGMMRHIEYITFLAVSTVLALVVYLCLNYRP